MRRGDLVAVVMTGDFGKPRPALVVQSDQFDRTGAATVSPLSGHACAARIEGTPHRPKRRERR